MNNEMTCNCQKTMLLMVITERMATIESIQCTSIEACDWMRCAYDMIGSLMMYLNLLTLKCDTPASLVQNHFWASL